MAIDKELLEILICPFCRGDVHLHNNETGLKCVSCRRVYPIRDGIPVMLIDEAKVED
ncbi:MAG: Trm112 family protein [Bryobacterales bacterium]|nr:Trm112 family protein [Bryobacterales bacterium]